MISARLLSEYRKAIAAVAETAGGMLSRTYQSLLAQGVSEAVMRDAMAEVAWAAASDLGNLASLAGAEFYESVRATQMPYAPSVQAWLADLPDYAVIDEQAHMSARFLFDREGPQGRVYKADSGMFFRELSANVERLIVDAARNTVVASAERDSVQPRVAVIARPGACDFCSRAAAEGWLVPENAARAHGIFHDHCRCFTAPSWQVMLPGGEVIDAPQF